MGLLAPSTACDLRERPGFSCRAESALCSRFLRHLRANLCCTLWNPCGKSRASNTLTVRALQYGGRHSVCCPGCGRLTAGAVSVPVLRSLVNGSGGPPAAFSFSWPPACAFKLDAHARTCARALDTGYFGPDGRLVFLSRGFSLLFLFLMKVFRSAEHGNFGGPTFFRQSTSASSWALRGRVAA